MIPNSNDQQRSNLVSLNKLKIIDSNKFMSTNEYNKLTLLNYNQGKDNKGGDGKKRIDVTKNNN
jgi:hypothetical protein